RGIGLDLVSDAARALGGEVRVTTTPGRGTSIALEVPCAVLSVPVLTVIAGDRTIAIPQAAVQRVTSLAPGELARGSLADEAGACKLIALARLLDAPVGVPTTAVVLAEGTTRAAIAIDRVAAIAQLVVRRLAASIPASPVIGGVALDAAGEPRPVLDPAAVIAAVHALRPQPGDAPPRPRPILVVDDSLTTRTLEQSMLEAAGYEVDVAASAELGLARAGERDYGLFLVDLEMPGLDGFGFIQAIRARGPTPAVLVTSRDTPADRRHGAEVGAQGYLIKGELDQHELLALVARLLA
ncbi:MAG TPA: response regulator, partial [Kofleriaceae bacterium]